MPFQHILVVLDNLANGYTNLRWPFQTLFLVFSDWIHFQLYLYDFDSAVTVVQLLDVVGKCIIGVFDGL